MMDFEHESATWKRVRVPSELVEGAFITAPAVSYRLPNAPRTQSWDEEVADLSYSPAVGYSSRGWYAKRMAQ